MKHATSATGRRRLLIAGLAAACAQAPIAVLQAQEVGVITPAGIEALLGANESKVVVVNFWATWCPPCLREFPDIIAVYEAYHDSGLEVVAVSMNEADEAADIADFLTKFAPPFAVYRASSTDAEFYEGVQESWFGEMPMTLIFDRRGGLAHVHKKPLTYEELASQVADLLD